MNELVFLGQTLLIIAFTSGALRLGKEALATWIFLQALIANLFVLKQITLFGLEVTASDAFAIGSLLGLNFLQEFFGRDEAGKATLHCFFFLSFFALASQLHLFFIPNPADQAHEAFRIILSPSLRLLAASITVFFIVQQVDIRLFGFLKERWTFFPFALRAALSLSLSQVLDTVLFSFVGLYGLVSSLFDIIVMSLVIKTIVIVTLSFWVQLASTLEKNRLFSRLTQQKSRFFS